MNFYKNEDGFLHVSESVLENVDFIRFPDGGTIKYKYRIIGAVIESKIEPGFVFESPNDFIAWKANNIGDRIEFGIRYNPV